MPCSSVAISTENPANFTNAETLPVPQSFPASQITSVFGEGRPATGTTPYPPTYFHFGTDIGNNCATNHTVGAIFSGIVRYIGPEVPGCASTYQDCIRIQDSSGRAFDYIHVVPAQSIADGVQVSAGQAIGYIDNENHLHLDEVDVTNGIKVNPETNGLEFSDADYPAFDSEMGLYETQIPTPEGGTVSGDIIPVVPGSAGEIALNQVPVGSEFAGDFAVNPAANTAFNVVVTANGNNYLRKGLYAVGLTLAWAGTPQNFLYDNGSSDAGSGQNIEFDSLNDADPYTGANTIYLQRNANSDAYFATNSGIPSHQLGSIDQADSGNIDISDSSRYPAGVYKLCANIMGLSEIPLENNSSECIPIIISRGPTLAIQPPESGPVSLAPTPAGAQWFGAGPTAQSSANGPAVATLVLSDDAGLAGLNIYTNDTFSQTILSQPITGAPLKQAVVASMPQDGAGFAAYSYY
ncbi:MAG: M23 family metallopeptidase [Elusimicrobiota bacterium]